MTLTNICSKISPKCFGVLSSFKKGTIKPTQQTVLTVVVTKL